jgi:hypothetical protein
MRTHPSSGRRLAAFASLAVAAGALACRPATRQDVDMAQAVTELQAAFGDLRQVQQEQQDQIDSLRLVVQQRDSVVRQLANLAGVSIPP